MKYEYLTITPCDEAVTIYLSALKAAKTGYKTETIPTRQSCGRVNAAAVYANRCSPHYCACAMDGIALMAELTYGASEGSPAVLKEGHYVWVDTGDPLPNNCDCVVMVENVVEADNGEILLYAAAVPWQNVRQIGEDISMGDMIMPSFSHITPALIGALLAAGVFSLEVIKKPVVAIIPTGDEIVEPEAELAVGDIPEFNSAIFSAMLSEWGADSKIYSIVPDTLEEIEQAIQQAASECDAVIMIAGSSAGREDYTAAAIKNAGALVLHGIAIKPGKPAVLGHIGPAPFVGVPGYPVSGIIVMEEIVKRVISLMTCKPFAPAKTIEAAVSKNVNSSLKYQEYIRSRLGYIGGEAVAIPMDRGAGIVTGFAKASAMLIVPQDSEGLQAGEHVPVRLLRPLEEIQNSISVIGSHDPLIDEIADLMKRSDINLQVSSGHVGSMGGIMTLKRNETHICGIHLLDAASGAYNTSYVKKYFPEGQVTLIRGVGRLQGLMVKKGNPHAVSRLEDIAEMKLSYVNRQKGSGTRILLDYLLAKNRISPDALYGYSREEYTHTAVAAIIAQGSADAGLGIFSAAKIYDLDFLPLWNEEYDFLVSHEALKLESVKRFFEILKCEEMKTRLMHMGGYTFKNIGEPVDLEG